MAEQQMITDFFRTTKKGQAKESLKRKLTDCESTACEASTTVSTPTKRAKSISLKSRSQLLVELAQASPVKPASPIKRDRPIVDTSPIKYPDFSKPVPKSPLKPKTDPSYKRFKYLAEKDSDKQLFLPSKYCKLVDTFTSVDGILSLLQKQNQQTTFDRVKQGVERISNKTFNQLKLSQLKTVYEEAYILRYDKTSQSDRNQLSKMSMTLIIIPSRSDSGTELIPLELKPSVIGRRKNDFISRLVEMVKEHHQKFLLTLDPPIRVDKKKIIKWHPNFQLEGVPDIEIKSDLMPPAPLKKAVQLTVDSFLTKTKRPQDMTTGKKDDLVDKTVPESPSKITTGHLKGISTSLLNKIRAKEAQNVARDLMRSPETDRKLGMIKMFPKYMRSLRNLFVGEQKTTMPLETIVKKLRDSYPTFVSAPEVEEHLEYMSYLLPDWLLILKVRTGSFVKMQNISKNLSDLETRLTKRAQEIEATSY